MSDSKRRMQPTKKLKKKKCAQSRIPLIIPSDTLQAYTNQVTQPQVTEPQHPPQSTQSPTQSTRSQHSPRFQPPLRSTQSQPQPLARSRPPPQSKPQPQPLARSRPPPPPQSTQSQPQPLARSRPPPQSTQSQPQPPTQSTQSQPPPPPQSTRSQPIPTQAVYIQEYPAGNAAHSSSSHVSGENDANKISILPEGDGFDRHKLVVSEIASIIRSNLEEGIPSWKKLSEVLRDEWFRLLGKKFTWPPEYKEKVRRNFERRGSAKMAQLMQEARGDLEQKPTWMGEAMWAQLKAYWGSSKFKKKSAINQRNRESMDGASLHTGGSIPHRLHWKRMKEEKGTDPSLTDFYFRTHRKKDQSWVGVHAEAAYDKFQQKKIELSSQNSTVAPGEDGADSQPSIEMPSDLDIWVDTVGKKKGRVFGLGSVTKTLISSSTGKTKKPDSEEVDALRSQIHALNESLQRQFQRHEQEKMEMRQELTETRRQITALMEHLGYAASSSCPPSSPQNYNNENDDDSDDFSDHLE